MSALNSVESKTPDYMASSAGAGRNMAVGPSGGVAIGVDHSAYQTLTGREELDAKQQQQVQASKQPAAQQPGVVSSLLHKTRESVSALTQYPSNVKCSACAMDCSIPAEAWRWHCSKGHASWYSNSHCADLNCGEARPADLHRPSLKCGGCGAVTTLPRSEASNFVKGSLAMAGAQINTMQTPPAQFHCSSCNALLQQPMGPWQCQSCSGQNEANAASCHNCSQEKVAQHLRCAACSQATAPERSTLVDRVKAVWRGASKQGQKLVMTATGTSHVDCPTCHAPVKLPTHGEQQHAPQQNEQQMSSTDGSSSQASVGSGSRRGSVWSVDLKCTSCKTNFSLMSEQAAADAQLPADTKLVVQQLPTKTQNQLAMNAA